MTPTNTPSMGSVDLAEIRRAADAILAPLTMEVGRLLEENPGADVTLVCFGEEIKLTAKHFMDLYNATDFDLTPKDKTNV